MSVSGNFSIPTALNSLGNMLTENIRKKEMIDTVREHLKNTIYHMKANRFTFFGLRKYFDPLFAAKEKADKRTLKALDEVDWVENINDIAAILKVHCASLNWFEHFEGHTHKLITTCNDFFLQLAYLKPQPPKGRPVILYTSVPENPIFITGSPPQNKVPPDGFHVAMWESPDSNELIKYEGEWKDGLFHGEGIFSRIDAKTHDVNTRYTGSFKNGFIDGQGRLELKDTFYEGEFKHNFMHGKGYHKHKTRFEYEGQFVKGLRSKNGVLKMGSSASYKGHFMNDRYNGYGIYTESDGTKYKGYFKEGKLHGKGRYIWPHGAYYKGEFKEGKKHGKGCHIWRDGLKYDGIFVNNEPNGAGQMTWSDGTKAYVDGIIDGRFWADVTFKNGLWVRGWFLNGKVDNSLYGEETIVTFKGKTWNTGIWVNDHHLDCDKKKLDEYFTDKTTGVVMDDPVFLPEKEEKADGWKIKFKEVSIESDNGQIIIMHDFNNGQFLDRSSIETLLKNMEKNENGELFFKNPFNRDPWTRKELEDLLNMNIEKEKNKGFLRELHNVACHISDL